MAPLSADPERVLALSYAPRSVRPSLDALWALDEQLADLLRKASDPMVVQMRMTWWHDALSRLPDAPAHPLLRALATAVDGGALIGADLAAMIDGWEALIDPEPIDEARLQAHAAARGGALFRLSAALVGADADEAVVWAGEGWALVDLTRHSGNAVLRDQAMKLAATKLSDDKRWPKSLRFLGALTMLAIDDVEHGPARLPPVGAPSRVWRMLRHRITGR